MTVQLTTSDLLARGTALLAPVLERPSLDAGILLAFSLGVPPVRLKSHPEEARTDTDLERYLALIERRAQGEPLAYITGVREFWTLQLRVTRDVLVPRPETELLVERALGLCRRRPRACWIWAPAPVPSPWRWRPSGRPGRSSATDASTAALAVARDNARRLRLANVSFACRLAGFRASTAQRFDLVVSNPPYVDARDPALLPLKDEPRQALTPGADALADLRTIIRCGAASICGRAAGWPWSTAPRRPARWPVNLSRAASSAYARTAILAATNA